MAKQAVGAIWRWLLTSGPQQVDLTTETVLATSRKIKASINLTVSSGVISSQPYCATWVSRSTQGYDLTNIFKQSAVKATYALRRFVQNIGRPSRSHCKLLFNIVIVIPL